MATDHLESDSLRALTIDDLFDIVARHRLHFDQARQVGVVFHMISCLTEHGRVGMTAVGNTAAEAEAIYQRAEKTLFAEARRRTGRGARAHVRRAPVLSFGIGPLASIPKDSCSVVSSALVDEHAKGR